MTKREENEGIQSPLADLIRERYMATSIECSPRTHVTADKYEVLWIGRALALVRYPYVRTRAMSHGKLVMVPQGIDLITIHDGGGIGSRSVRRSIRVGLAGFNAMELARMIYDCQRLDEFFVHRGRLPDEEEEEGVLR